MRERETEGVGEGERGGEGKGSEVCSREESRENKEKEVTGEKEESRDNI